MPLHYVATVLTFLAIAPPALPQVPPPPMHPVQEDVAEKLVQAFAAKDLPAYASLLASNVQVFEDGKNVALNKEAWLRRFGPKLAAEGVTFNMAPGFASTGRLLFIEYFNSLASWGRDVPPACCWGYDAVAYDIVDGKIQTIRRLRGGEFRLGADGRHAEH